MNSKTEKLITQALSKTMALALFLLPLNGSATIASEIDGKLKIAKAKTDEKPEGKSTAAGESVKKVLLAQRDAWNKGDLDNFMSGYVHTDKLSFTSAGNIVWGYDALRERYQKKYGQSKETMGKLEFSDLKTYDLGPENELMIGRWHLDLATTSLDGVFSLVFVNTKEGWRIMHDHTSLAEKRPAEPSPPEQSGEKH